MLALYWFGDQSWYNDLTIVIPFLGFISDTDLMKERFAKLLLGEDMSGGGKGVSSALALSNAITNLAGTFIFLIDSLFRQIVKSKLCRTSETRCARTAERWIYLS